MVTRLAVAALLLLSGWAAAALYFDVRSAWWNILAALLYIAFVALLIRKTRCSVRGMLLWLASVAAVLGWWFSLQPTNDRPWRPEVAQTAWWTMDGDRVTIHNVRNFVYRTETDFTPRWEIRTADLSQIRSVDLFLTHFGSPLIAHGIVSFRFGNGSAEDTFLAMSIEERQAIGQTYSTIRGFFRQYELIYIVADEKDVVRLRTDYRTGEDVRLYHTRMNQADSRRFFLQYLDWINAIHIHPQWYNALTDNCTSSITAFLERMHIGGLSRWDWRNVFNGYGDEMLYDDGDLVTDGLPFDELARRAVINDKAKKLGDDPNFSHDIRRGIPGFGSEETSKVEVPFTVPGVARTAP